MHALAYIWLLCILLGLHCAAATRRNVLFVCVDNLRPAIGAYGNTDVYTPRMDEFAARPGSSLFSRAFCQLAWCAPSRNSFLTGRRPDVTKAWNFLDSFRELGIGEEWVTLPQYFKQHGYYTTSVGKVFHPNLPPNFDYPRSWSDEPYFPVKPDCPGNTMICEYDNSNSSSSNNTFFDADVACADAAVHRLRAHMKSSPQTPFFVAVGFQAPRLPWSYPSSAASHYPDPMSIPVAEHAESPRSRQHEELEWFRPTEVDMYSDIRNITHGAPMSKTLQHLVRKGYYSTVTHIDEQFGRVLDALDELELRLNTTVVLFADHGQNLGEHNMWSMMNVLESSHRVPLMWYNPWMKEARSSIGALVELVDLYPTLVSIAGLPPAPESWGLPGADLTPLFEHKVAVKAQAEGQITRCKNCFEAYKGIASQCIWDVRADSNWTVPCANMPRTKFDWMGYTIRTHQWRYTLWCAWNGSTLSADWSNCSLPELYSHKEDVALFDVDHHENVNLAHVPAFAGVVALLDSRLRSVFGGN